MTLPNRHATDARDVRYLQSELMMRMIVQNIVIITNALLFLPVAASMIVGIRAAATMALAYTITATILAAVWCHHGARQAQIKHYILLSEVGRGAAESWEIWLPNNRSPGFLGARWVISTKVPFVTTTATACLLGFAFDTTTLNVSVTTLNMLVIAGLTILLWTNPKEGSLRSSDLG